MANPRIFVPFTLATQTSCLLSAAISQHLKGALRLQRGDEITLFNSQILGEFSAIITDMHKSQVEVRLEKFIPYHRESELIVNLGQGISRGEKMDFTIQKAVELGVHSITPLFSTYCNVKLEGERLARRLAHWQNIAISACEQSGRCLVPQILPAQQMESWFLTHLEKTKIIFDPRATQKLSSLTGELGEITIAIGPEGGFSDHEIMAAQNHGFIPLTLGKRILRTETAALAAMGALQMKFGDF